MSRTLEEKETIIRWDETNELAYIYTHSRALQNRLKRLKATQTDKEGLSYRIDKSYILVRRPRRVSQASRDMARERFTRRIKAPEAK